MLTVSISSAGTGSPSLTSSSTLRFFSSFFALIFTPAGSFCTASTTALVRPATVMKVIDVSSPEGCREGGLREQVQTNPTSQTQLTKINLSFPFFPFPHREEKSQCFGKRSESAFASTAAKVTSRICLWSVATSSTVKAEAG